MEQSYQDFNDAVWQYYHEHGRELPWRQVDQDGLIDPYYVLVSEIMLQQTQAQRVIPKYEAFLLAFPTVQTLAAASLDTVLAQWNGLGYNRRAKFLWQAAQRVVDVHGGIMPSDEAGLVALPGVGVNTARAVLAYAYNQPVVFVETNIRTVFIHHFFEEESSVHDKAILELVAETVDKEHPREWYWALMDYGTHLKKTVGNLSRSSKHYTKQTTFAGSKRQVRGQIIKRLIDGPKSYEALQREIDDDRFAAVVDDLLREELIRQTGIKLHL